MYWFIVLTAVTGFPNNSGLQKMEVHLSPNHPDMAAPCARGPDSFHLIVLRSLSVDRSHMALDGSVPHLYPFKAGVS